MRIALLILLAALSAEARTSKKAATKRPPPDPRTQGLGHSCESTKGCRKGQRCLKMADMNGKPEKTGFCVLPCAPIDYGTTKVTPGEPIDPSQTQKILSKKTPPRCPAKFQCHGADASTPIDICVKE